VKRRLDELSLKSFDVPVKAVANDLSKTFSAILSIDVIPSPIVLPGARLAENVAET